MSTRVDPKQAFHRGTAPIFAILSIDQARQMDRLPVESPLADYVEEFEFNLKAILQAEARFRWRQSGA